MTPRSDPHTETIRDALGIIGWRAEPALAALAALESERDGLDEDFKQTCRQFDDYVREYGPKLVAAEARVTQLEGERDEALASVERLERVLYLPQRGDGGGTPDVELSSGFSESARTDAPLCQCKWGASGAHDDGCPCALGVVADGGGGRDEDFEGEHDV